MEIVDGSQNGSRFGQVAVVTRAFLPESKCRDSGPLMDGEALEFNGVVRSRYALIRNDDGRLMANSSSDTVEPVNRGWTSRWTCSGMTTNANRS